MSFASSTKGSGSLAVVSRETGFVELEELTCKNKEVVWKETARWIKFEEDVEESAHRWGKPHIPCLNFNSIRDLKNIISNGVVLFDLDERNIKDIAESVVELAISNGLPVEERDTFVSLLVTPRHQHELKKGGIRRYSKVTAAAYNELSVIEEGEIKAFGGSR